MTTFENDFASSAGIDARERVQEALATARDFTSEALAQGGEYVRERPRVALIAAFGLGVVAGVALAAALRPAPRRRTAFEESRERLAEVFGTVAANLRDPLRRTYESVSDRAGSLGEIVASAVDKVRRARS
jgi:hypothetical protein